MRTYFWNQDTGLVSPQMYTRSLAQAQAVRGEADVQVVMISGSPLAALLQDPATVVGIIVRDPANLKAGCLAGPTVLTRGANAAAGYTGTTSTDTTLTRTLMHVDPSDATNESPSYAATAVFYYVPAGGVEPIESAPFPWTIQANYYRPNDPPAQNAPGYPVDGGSPSSVYANANLDGGTP